MTRQGVTVWLVCALFFLYEFLLRTVVGTFQHPIMYDLNLTSVKFTLLSTATYLVIYGFMQIPAGFIVERFGLKKTLFFACTVCACATLGFAYASTFGAAIFFRILTGLGCSFGFICLLVAVYDWLPQKNITFLIGVSQFIGTMGPMLAAGPLESLSSSSQVNWRLVFIGLALIGGGISFLILFLVKNNHEKTGSFTILKRPEPIVKALKALTAKSQPWVIAFFSAGVYFAIEYLSENEGTDILIAKGLSSSKAAYMLTLAWFSHALGCPFFGYLSDKFARRKLLMRVSALCCVGSMILIMTASSAFFLSLAFVLLGLGASGQNLGFAAIAEHFEKKYLATALALNNMIIMIVISVNAPLVSFYLDYVKGSAALTCSDYFGVFIVLLTTAGGTLILASFFIKETYCKSQANFTLLRKHGSVPPFSGA